MNKTLRTSEVAAEANVNVETLRYYERRGLLDEPPRLPSGQRQYSATTVRRVKAIKQAQSLGFTLDEIESLLLFRDRPNGTNVEGAVVRAAREKLAQVEEKEAALREIKVGLQDVIAKGCTSLVDCDCGDCPLDDESSGRGSRQNGNPAAGDALLQNRATRLNSFAPAGLFAALACSICLLPAVFASLLGIGAVSAIGETLEVAPLTLVAMALLAAAVLVIYPMFSKRDRCSCHAS